MNTKDFIYLSGVLLLVYLYLKERSDKKKIYLGCQTMAQQNGWTFSMPGDSTLTFDKMTEN